MSPGDPVRRRLTKWGGTPHWGYDAHWLGEDEQGGWVGVPAGTVVSRPGQTVETSVDHVYLVPRDAWWLASFHAPGGRSRAALDGAACDVYVDITTPAVLTALDGGSLLEAVDLDLDVIRGSTGMVVVDDEDEFAEHQVSLGYPPEVVAAAQAACAVVLDLVTRREPPFDGAISVAWLARLAALR